MTHSWSLSVYSPHQGVVIVFTTSNKAFCGILGKGK
jgi:hypothetical protein